MSQKVECPSDAPSEHSEQAMSEERISVDIENPDFNSSIEQRVNNEDSVSSNFH